MNRANPSFDTVSETQEQPRQWTPMIGLRQLLLRQSLRTVVGIIVLAGFIWLLTPVLNSLALHWSTFGVLGVALLPIGAALGYGLTRKLSEIAGFAGLIPTVITIGFAWLTVWAAVHLADLLRPLGAWQATLVILATGIWAMGYALKEMLMDQ